VEAKVHRDENSPHTGVISLDCPEDSDCLGLEFYTPDGEFIPFLGCRYLLRSRTFFHNGVTIMASEESLASNPIVQEIMSVRPDASAGAPGTFILEQRINIIGFRKQGNMYRFIYIVDEPCETASFNYLCDDDQTAIVAPALIFPLYDDGGPLYFEVWVPEIVKEVYLEARDLNNKPVAGSSAIFEIDSRSLVPVDVSSPGGDLSSMDDEAFRSSNLPIEYILMKRVEFGPRGVVLGNKALSILKASRDGEGQPLKLTIFLDDGGHFESVCWWHQKMEHVQNTPFFRSTPSCPAVIELAINDPQTILYLDFADSNERISTDLAVVFDMSRGCLREQDGIISPARDRYKPSSTDSSTCRCIACKRESSHESALHISELPEEERYHLLSSMKFDWDYSYLCDKCRHRINDSSGVSIAVVSQLHDRRLQEGVIGLFKAYAASFFIFITPGQFLVSIFTSMPFYFSPGGATFASAVLISAVFSMIPLQATASMVSSASKMWDEGNIFRQFIQMIGIPAIIIVIITDSYFSFKYPFQYPEGTNPFYWGFLYYAAFTGFCIGTTAMAGLGKVLHSGAEYKKKWDLKLKRTGRILSGMSNLVHVERMADLYEGLKKLLAEELNVQVFIVFQPDQDRLFRPKYAYGTEVKIVRNWTFKAGDAGLPGQSLFFSEIMDITTYEKGLEDKKSGKTPFPALWCIPVVVDSQVASLLTISAFTVGSDNSEMDVFLPAVSAIISAALSNIERLANKERLDSSNLSLHSSVNDITQSLGPEEQPIRQMETSEAM
jgi:hypothetical protein